jgi:hypothetical protein
MVRRFLVFGLIVLPILLCVPACSDSSGNGVKSTVAEQPKIAVPKPAGGKGS